MLKAYNYIDETGLNVALQDKRIFDKEKSIAVEFISNNHQSQSVDNCVVCGGKRLDSFATIFKVNYFRCCDCHSIFTPASDETLSSYKIYNPLIKLRQSKEYQDMATEKRTYIWDELIFWIQFRCARYLNRNNSLNIYDYGNRFQGLSQKIRESNFCGKYSVESVVLGVDKTFNMPADVVLYLDTIGSEANPTVALQQVLQHLSDDGILILSTRVGTGFDILTLKGGAENIIPYDHTVLLSIEGLELILKNANLELLEISTPGALDVEYVVNNINALEPDNLFINYMLQKADSSILLDFQRFLQKSGLSSHSRVIARKKS